MRMAVFLIWIWRNILYSEVGFPFKPNIRTNLENNPAGLLWCGDYICFGRKVLNDFVYYQWVMTFLENKKLKGLLVSGSFGRQIENSKK